MIGEAMVGRRWVAVVAAGVVMLLLGPGVSAQARVMGAGPTHQPLTGSGQTAALYWTSFEDPGGTISKANLNGTGGHVIVSGQAAPVGITVDCSHIYWADFDAGTIKEASLDGRWVKTLVSGQSYPVGVAVYRNHIYWANSQPVGGGTIMRANLNGTAVTTLVTGQSNPQGITVDSSHIYWADPSGGIHGTIGRSSLDGTGVTTLVTGQFAGPSGVAVDSSHIFWTNESTVMTANLDGTDITGLPDGGTTLTEITIYGSHIYWVDEAGKINEAKLDGTGATTLISGLKIPYGVAVGP
jgi:virginiamycin B lyase